MRTLALLTVTEHQRAHAKSSLAHAFASLLSAIEIMQTEVTCPNAIELKSTGAGAAGVRWLKVVPVAQRAIFGRPPLHGVTK